MSEVARSLSRDVSRLATLPELVEPDGIFADGDWIESKDQDPGGDVRLIQLADVGDGIYRDRSNRFLTMEKAKELNCTFLKPGDVLIARMPEPLGRACIFPGDEKPSVTAVDVCIVRPDSGDVNPRWLLGAINAPQFRSQVAALQSGTTRKRISRKNLGLIKIPVPPKAEQDLTSSLVEQQFTRLDAAVAALQRIKSNVKRYRASVLRAACTGYLSRDGLGPAAASGRTVNAPNGLPTVPPAWQWKTFEQIAERITVGHVGPMKDEYVSEGVPFLRSQNVRPNRFDARGLKFISPAFHAKLKKSRLQPGDVIVVRSGDVGTACVVPVQLEDANCADLVIIQRPQAVHSKFAAYYLNSVAKSLIQAGKVGVALTHFNTKSVASLPVPVPPREEQEVIVGEVERRFSVIDELEGSVETELKRAVSLRQVILQHAFSRRLTGV